MLCVTLLSVSCKYCVDWLLFHFITMLFFGQFVVMVNTPILVNGYQASDAQEKVSLMVCFHFYSMPLHMLTTPLILPNSPFQFYDSQSHLEPTITTHELRSMATRRNVDLSYRSRWCPYKLAVQQMLLPLHQIEQLMVGSNWDQLAHCRELGSQHSSKSWHIDIRTLDLVNVTYTC